MTSKVDEWLKHGAVVPVTADTISALLGEIQRLRYGPEYLPPGAGEKQLAADSSRGGQRDPLLAEREKTHGSFERNARIAQQLKDVFYPAGRREEIKSDVHREALDMIALKLSRILSGQANYADHWIDIAGYAKLASEACK